MTKPIPHGTRNLALNFVEEELQIIRLEAFRRNLSMKEFFMRNFRRGVALSDPQVAKRLVRIKRDRLKATLMLAAFLTWFFGADESSARRPRVVRLRFKQSIVLVA